MVRILVDYTFFEKSTIDDGDYRTIVHTVKPIKKAYIFNGLPERKVRRLEKILEDMCMSSIDKEEFNNSSTTTKRLKELKYSYPVYNMVFYRLETDRNTFERIVAREVIPLGNIMEDIFAAYFGLAIHYPYSTEHWNTQNTHLQSSTSSFGTQHPFPLIFGGKPLFRSRGFDDSFLQLLPPQSNTGFSSNNIPPPQQQNSLDIDTQNKLVNNFNLKRDYPDDNIDNNICDSHSNKRQHNDFHPDNNDNQSNDIKPISPLSNIINEPIPENKEELEEWFYRGSIIPKEPNFESSMINGEDFKSLYSFNDAFKVDADNNDNGIDINNNDNPFGIDDNENDD